MSRSVSGWRLSRLFTTLNPHYRKSRISWRVNTAVLNTMHGQLLTETAEMTVCIQSHRLRPLSICFVHTSAAKKPNSCAQDSQCCLRINQTPNQIRRDKSRICQSDIKWWRLQQPGWPGSLIRPQINLLYFNSSYLKLWASLAFPVKSSEGFETLP